MHTLRWAQPGWPSVAPEGDPVSVGGLLVITAEAGLPETTRSLLLSIPRDVEVHPIRLTELAERFAALGFHYAELIHFIHGAEAGEMGLPEGVALQPLREVDLGALQLCIRDVFSQDASAFFCGGDAAEQESFLRTLEGSQAMREASSVALVRGTELLGFATTAGDSENGNLLIDWMGIRPAFRKQGLARALLRCVLSCAAFEGYRTASLSSDARNEPALSLYQSAGWDVGGGERQFVKQIG